jgi:hypothetical protein
MPDSKQGFHFRYYKKIPLAFLPHTNNNKTGILLPLSLKCFAIISCSVPLISWILPFSFLEKKSWRTIWTGRSCPSYRIRERNDKKPFIQASKFQDNLNSLHDNLNSLRPSFSTFSFFPHELEHTCKGLALGRESVRAERVRYRCEIKRSWSLDDIELFYLLRWTYQIHILSLFPSFPDSFEHHHRHYHHSEQIIIKDYQIQCDMQFT